MILKELVSKLSFKINRLFKAPNDCVPGDTSSDSVKHSNKERTVKVDELSKAGRVNKDTPSEYTLRITKTRG